MRTVGVSQFCVGSGWLPGGTACGQGCVGDRWAASGAGLRCVGEPGKRPLQASTAPRFLTPAPCWGQWCLVIFTSAQLGGQRRGAGWGSGVQAHCPGGDSSCSPE